MKEKVCVCGHSKGFHYYSQGMKSATMRECIDNYSRPQKCTCQEFKEEKMKEYIVSFRVSFETPVDIKAKNEKNARHLAEAQFRNIFNNVIEPKLNDCASLEIEIDYVEQVD